jgi:NTE family protein
MKVGLVLGAGGVLGGAWHTGALHALARETDWDPASAEFIVGTSAGSVIGSLVAAGVPPWFMVAHSRGESFEGLSGPDGRPARDADRSGGATFKLHRGLPAIGPGSLRMALGALANPLSHTPLQLVAGWVPAGVMSTDSIKDTVRRAVPGRWADHPNFWAVATDYSTGKRVPFGRLGAPAAELADAVAASCAIPGFYRPVKIGGRRYVDGGVCSPSNLDLLAGRGLDLVICLNPLSSRTGSTGFGALDRFNALGRTNNGRRLGHEARKVEAYGTRVALIQPTAEDHAVMGRNLMNGARRNAVIETAERTVAEQLAQPELAELVDGLLAGEPHKLRRPEGPPSSWPELLPSQRREQAA